MGCFNKSIDLSWNLCYNDTINIRKEALIMENKNGKVALNDDLLDLVSGGDGPAIPLPVCTGCRRSLGTGGVCMYNDCSLSPYYVPIDPNTEWRII